MLLQKSDPRGPMLLQTYIRTKRSWNYFDVALIGVNHSMAKNGYPELWQSSIFNAVFAHEGGHGKNHKKVPDPFFTA